MKRSDFVKQIFGTLIARRDALRKTLAGDAVVLHGIHGTGVGDEIDAALESEQTEMRSQMASYESRELAQIDSAIEKIKGGTYGRCERCEKAIAPLRLKVLPYATECIECARHEERRGTMPMRSSGGGVNRIAAYDTEAALDETFEEIG